MDPQTTVAAAAGATSSAPPLLLRDWTYERVSNSIHNNNNDNFDQITATEATQTTRTTTEAAAAATLPSDTSLDEVPVPVAPAVVLSSSSRSEEKERRNNYPYPVATFVSNLVRQYGGEALSTTVLANVGNNASHHHPNAQDDHVLNQGESLLPAPQAPQHQQQVGRVTLEEAEYVIVDGDLIVVPPQRPGTSTTSISTTDDHESEARLSPDREPEAPLIDPDEVRKHKFGLKQKLKGIRKWIKKRATRVVKEEPAGIAVTGPQLHPLTSSADTTTTAVVVVAPTNAPIAPTSQGPASPTISLAGTRGARRKSTLAPEALMRKSIKAQRRQTWSSNRTEPPIPDDDDPSFTTGIGTSRSGPLDSISAPIRALTQNRRSSLLQQHPPNHTHHDALASISSDLHSDHVLDPVLAPTIIDEAAVVSSDGNMAAAAVNALFVGNVEQVLESGLMTNVTSAVAFVESEKHDDDFWYKKENDKMLQEEITLDSMLQLARHESSSEEEEMLESSINAVDLATLKEPPRLKIEDQDSVESFGTPLSEATTLDAHVWNDTLKVLLVGSGGVAVDKAALGRALAGKRPKRPKQLQHQAHSYYSQLGVDVHTWSCQPERLRFCLWDVYSHHSAGKHPATQSLFFSPNSLYILLWDLGVRTVRTTVMATTTNTTNFTTSCTNRRRASTLSNVATTDDEYDEDDDDADIYEKDDFMREEMIRATDRALELDIFDNVLSWLDPIAFRGAAILPVVVISSDASSSSFSSSSSSSTTSFLTPSEIQRRCTMLQMLLMKHPAFEGEGAPRLIFGNHDSIVRVVMDTGEGVPELQEMIHAIGKEKVFPHMQTAVDQIIVEVNQTIRRLKADHKVILLDHLMSEMKSRVEVEQVQDALHFLSNIGEISYYGNSTDEILSRFVILSRRWLASALSCILRPDLQRELDETRRFMNLQCVYSGEAFCESDVVQTLIQGTNSSCPILSAKDSAMLWKSMSFMRDAADRTAQLSEASSTMYDFLERLLVYSGIFMPFTVSTEPTYFVPSLLDTAAAPGVWTFKSSESWMTTLCHSWLLRDGAPSNIMEHVTTCLLQDLYEFSLTFQGATVKPVQHAKMYPLGISSMKEFMDEHKNEPVGRIKIHQVVCWKSCLLVKIGTVFADSDLTELRESFTEIFVALVDEQSEYCVATRNMSNSMKRLLVCGKGQVGHNGRKLWQGGFALVLDSLKASLADATGCQREVVCPECLAHAHPSVAGIWSWDTVQVANETGNAGVRCTRGHLVDTNLLCGVQPATAKMHVQQDALIHPHPRPRKPVSKLLNSVVVVALWDVYARQIRSVGSGFIVDKKLGLIVTAGHTLFDMTPGRKFGTPYLGYANAKVAIGVMEADGHHKAVFRYFAEIVSHDIRSVDACVMRITTKLENDVDGIDCGGQLEIPLNRHMKNERLSQLKMTRTFELEESIRILGFNQGGEGVLEQGKHVNRCADFAKGYICKRFTNVGSDDSSASSKGSSSSLSLNGGGNGCKDNLAFGASSNACLRAIGDSFVPREEIVVMCPTISGHSGGPCVNDEGRVVGILSRADPVDRQRCYLVPTTEIKVLINKAKEVLERFPS